MYFFPKLRLWTLRAFAAYQLDDGKVPFFLGHENYELNTPHYYAQYVVNGILYTQMVDRLCQRIGDNQLVHEFYAVVKRAMQFEMTL